jgi:hypothetical protein
MTHNVHGAELKEKKAGKSLLTTVNCKAQERGMVSPEFREAISARTSPFSVQRRRASPVRCNRLLAA